MVDRAPVSLGRDEAERDTDQRREQHRRDCELHGRRETVLDLLGDRPSRGDARAEVSRPHGLQVAPVLLVEWLVEAVLVAHLRDRLVGRPLAEERLGGRSGQRPDPDEDEQGEPDQDRDEEDQPADGEAEHGAPTSSSAGLSSRDPAPRYPTKRTVENGSRDTGLGMYPTTFFWNASAGFVWTYGTPGRNFMIMLFACR